MRKRRVVGRIYGMKYSGKGRKDRNRHKNRIRRSEQARLVYVKDITATSTPHEVEPAGTLTVRQRLGTNKLTRADW